jgi:hypothetical protein
MRLALHRMLGVEVGSIAFEHPADFDLQRFDTDGGISHATGKRVQLSFRLERKAAQRVIESPLAPDQEHVDEGSHIRFGVSYPDSLRLDRWLWSFGPEISEVRDAAPAPAPAVAASRAKNTTAPAVGSEPRTAPMRARSRS